MDREQLKRRICLFVAVGGWLFLLLSLASFSPQDWPSHQVYPHPATRNICGAVGAWVAYHLFFAIGQGVFPIIFFSGICLALLAFRNQISDIWLRAIGLALLSVAFAATVHLIRPGSYDSFPEGHGGIIGIGASSFLKNHFSTAGSGLVLLLTFLVGLLLTADDLVIRAPGFIGSAVEQIKARTPAFNFKFPALPKLPALPTFVTRDALAARAKDLRNAGNVDEYDDDGEPLKPATVLRQNRIGIGERLSAEQTVNGQTIELTYDNDEPAPAAVEQAFTGDADAPPAEHVVVPPVEQQVVVQPPPTLTPPLQAVINNLQPKVVSTQSNGGGMAPPRSVAVEQQRQAAPATAAVPAAASHDEGDEPAPLSDAPVNVIAPKMVELPETKDAEIVPEPVDLVATMEQQEQNGIIVRLPNAAKPRQLAPPPPKELGDYQLPPWDCLADAEHGYVEAQEKYVREKAAALEQAMKEFNIDARVVEIDTGPVITMYELQLAPGIKVATITQLTNDIARSLMATSVRIVAPVPGKSTVGIEVPNPVKEKVRIKELMQLAPEATRKMQIPLYLGKDASGEALVADLASMPHCLIAGTTGSGKSVCINTIIMSIMYTQRPDMVKMILVDPKVVEMAPFKEIPHLMCPVINDCGRATSVLEWACQKMDERYEFLAEAGVRNIKDFNKMTREELLERFKPETPEEEAKIPKFMSYVVIIIDELADLMMTSGKEVEASIVRLAQKSRAVGIHLILATQRPQANVVTGLIKSNMPTRIAFRVNSRMDSRIVLDQNGADLLLGQGDMLFLPPGLSKPIRSQGTFIDDKEIRESVKLVKGQAEAQFEPELVQIKASVSMSDMESDELFDDAVKVVLETKRGSVSLLQRRLNVGYSRASRLIEMMAASGILGDYKGSQAREVTMTLEDWETMKSNMRKDQEEGMSV